MPHGRGPSRRAGERRQAQNQPGCFGDAAALKRFSRRDVPGRGRCLRRARRGHAVHPARPGGAAGQQDPAVPDDFAQTPTIPNASWFLFPGYKTSWEEAQWILNCPAGRAEEAGPACRRRVFQPGPGHRPGGHRRHRARPGEEAHQALLLRPQLRRHGGHPGGRAASGTPRRGGGVHPAGFQSLQQERRAGRELVRRRGVPLRERLPGPLRAARAATSWGSGSSTRTSGPGGRSWTRRWSSCPRSRRPAC